MWLWLLVACGVDAELPSDVEVERAVPAAVAPAELSATTGLPVVLDGTGSEGLLTWEPGDGGPPVHAARAEHVYAQPGTFTATLTATLGGAVAIATTVVTVAAGPLPDLPARPSGPLVATPDGTVFVAMPDFDRVAVWSEGRAAVDHLDTCPRPRRLALGAQLAVICEEHRPAVQLWQLEGALPVLAHERTFADRGASPTGVTFDADGTLVVTLRARSGPEATLLRLDGALGIVEERTVGYDLRALGVARDGLLAARFRSAPDGGELHHVSALGVETWTLPALPPSPLGHGGVPNLLGALAVRPDGGAVAVGGLRANVGRGLYLDGQALTPTTTVRSELLLLDTAADAPARVLARADDLGTDRVAGLDFDGDRLYATHPGTEELTVHDGADLRLRGRVPLGVPRPEGLQVDGGIARVEADGGRLLVLLDPDHPDDRRVVDLLPPTGEVMAPAVRQGDILFHRSADPRMSVDGSTSCASCHPDGEQDGQNWDFTQFGEGVRNTQSLRGLARYFGPLHWTANFDEVQDFEQVMRNAQGGLGMLPDADWLGPAGPSLGAPKAGLSPDLDALAAYVLSLDLLDVPWDLPPGTTDQGFFAFIEGGCQNCHPNGGTDSHWQDDGSPVLHDIGSTGPASGQRLGAPLTGIDTPPLAGLWATPPYDHDGDAPTLHDSLEQSTILHGDAGEFRPDDHAAIQVYLRTL